MVFETNTAYFNSKSESEIEANAKASYMKMVSVSVGVSSSSGNVDESFTSNTKSSIKYYGGDLNVLASGGLSKWQPTVEGDPWLFTGKLKPISDLIKDPAKRLSMERAVKKHLLQAYITEQETLINVARAKSDNSVINSLLSRVAALKRKYNNNLLDKFKTIVYIPQNDNSDIDALARDLQEYVSVPSWFLTNTQMCLYWKGTSDWYQCNGNGNQGLCAITNSMTPWYIDWTNWRAGGCMMQWAIISANFPAWFNDVKICYQFYAEIDIRQCGGNAGAVYCANVNNYTPEYFDDTGDRNGGCRMRWMLQVPDTAPYWMKAVHMCYNWVADGDIAQCGGGAPTSQCVVANQWTTYYLDYSGMKWQGGCKMSWGLKTVY
ncbi:perivitellin-2 67 kDa subunit-like [Physella acuta]|uniref:perivitellin-2 67 kDa subunit-like n=1 Tax=Physella acuta TaxID=109671 RepID=UPI0027DAE2FB|nr:perivitellin-2 67 kDa subunit-like [Physella acuta]